MYKEKIVTTHIRAARKLIQAEEHFAAVLCSATGVERAVMGLITHLGVRPASKHRHHEVLRLLKPIIPEEHRSEYQRITEGVAELMGHLTMAKYKLEVGGEYKTPKEFYSKTNAEKLHRKAEEITNFIERYTSS